VAVGVLDHGAELEHLEARLATAPALLAVEDRAAIVEFDGEGNGEPDEGGEDEHEAGEGDVEYSLGEGVEGGEGRGCGGDGQAGLVGEGQRAGGGGSECHGGFLVGGICFWPTVRRRFRTSRVCCVNRQVAACQAHMLGTLHLRWSPLTSGRDQSQLEAVL